MARPEWIEVGRISRPHGVRGEVRVTLSSDNPERFTDGSVLHGRPGRMGMAKNEASGRLALTIDTVRGEADFPIVSFAEVPSREAAEAIRGYVLEVRSSELPRLSEGQFYPFDLEGLVVKDAHGSTVGRVREVIDSPAHPLLAVLLDGGGEVLVPFVEAAVPDIQVDEGHLVVGPGFLGAIGGGESGPGEGPEGEHGTCSGGAP